MIDGTMNEEANKDASKRAASQEAAALEPDCDAQDGSTNVSQTHFPQMTASSVNPIDTAKWMCEVCTYENYPLSRKCTMCRTAKPVFGEDIFKLQDGASALPTLDTSDAEAVTERLKPLRISSPQGQASASSVSKWPCPTCTYENWPKSLKCAMCGTSAHAAAAPAPPSTPDRPSIGVVDIGNSQPPLSQEADARRNKRRTNTNANTVDWTWLQACLGVVEGDARRVDAYLSCGGDPARALTPHELELLDRASAFDAGHTLVHLAIRFQRQEILTTLLSRISGGGPGLKRSPSYIAPDLASAIRRHMASCMRARKGSFPCPYINEFCTFSLPAEIDELPAVVSSQLRAELLDGEAARALCGRAPRTLLPLWNRSAGDCLPDALCQAAYGVADRAHVLRAALADALRARALYERWAGWERAQAARLHYAPDDAQLRAEWARLAAAAARPKHALRQLHVFALAHILRRPILVYGVDLVRSHRGDALGYARFRGLYLPLLWEPDFCSKSPLCLGYTRGHFCALVPVEAGGDSHDYICREQEEENEDVTFLPLTDSDGKLLPLHFLSCDEMEEPEVVLRRFVCVCRARDGRPAARQLRHARPLLQAQMLEEWLNHYRRLAQQSRGPFPPRPPPDLSSEPDSDEE